MSKLYFFLCFCIAAVFACGSGSSGKTQSEGSKDTQPPEIIMIAPPDGEEDVALIPLIIVAFNEKMDETSINSSTFQFTNGIDAIQGQIIYNPEMFTATFNLFQPLNISTPYFVKVTSDICDQAGNTLSDTYSWSFSTTSAQDIVAPSISSTSPGSNASDVSIDSHVSAVFSEFLDSSTVTNLTFVVKDGKNEINGTVTYEAQTMSVIFEPASFLPPNTLLTAIVANEVCDLSGNPMDHDYSWKFTTEDQIESPLFWNKDNWNQGGWN